MAFRPLTLPNQQATPQPVLPAKTGGFRPLQAKQVVQPTTSTGDKVMSGAEAVSGAINAGYQALKTVSPLGWAAGGAVGAAGGVLGGAVGAIGTPFANLAKGRPLFENLGKNIKETARDTASFGLELGREGGTAAPLGRIPQAIITVPMLVDAVKDFRAGNYGAAGAKLGASALSV